jgi:hypothetical protein
MPGCELTPPCSQSAAQPGQSGASYQPSATIALEGLATGYFARNVFDLLTIAERRLAGTRWDTRHSAPSRPVPALPQRCDRLVRDGSR